MYREKLQRKTDLYGKRKSTYDSILQTSGQTYLEKNADKKLTCNGEVIENQAFVTATLMLKDKDNPPDDLERVWVNTHLNIKKSVEKKEYKAGETVNIPRCSKCT